MTDETVPYSWQASIERRLSRIEQLEPAVTRQQVADMKEDIKEIKDGQDSIRRILIGLLISWGTIGITVVVALFAQTGG